MNKLLKKAKKTTVGSRAKRTAYTKDELEVAVAYLKGQITIRQYAAAIGKKNPGSITHRTSCIIHWGMKYGHLKIRLI